MRANKIYRQSHLYTWPAHTLFGLFSSEIQVDTTLATAHCFSLISFRLKSNKATKVAPISADRFQAIPEISFPVDRKRTMFDGDDSRTRERYNCKNSNGYQTYDYKD